MGDKIHNFSVDRIGSTRDRLVGKCQMPRVVLVKYLILYASTLAFICSFFRLVGVINFASDRQAEILRTYYLIIGWEHDTSHDPSHG